MVGVSVLFVSVISMMANSLRGIKYWMGIKGKDVSLKNISIYLVISRVWLLKVFEA